MTFVTAHVVARLIGQSDGTDKANKSSQTAIWLGAQGCAFFIPFYVLGAAELFWSFPRLSLASLIMTQTLVTGSALASGSWLARNRGMDISFVGLNLWRSNKFFDFSTLGGKIAVATILIFLLLGIMLMMGFPRGFEVHAYHLPIAANIFQTGSLRVWDDQYMHTIPVNMSLFAGYFMQFLPERSISALNLPFLAMACFVVYGLARLAGGDTESSVLAAAGLTTIPIVAFSSLEVGADIPGMAFLGLAFWIVLAAPRGGTSWIFLAGLCAGLAYGFKALHLVGGAFLGLVVLLRAWKEFQEISKPAPLIGAFHHGTWFTCGFVLTAGFWLLRNAIELGNPLYPVHIGPVFDLLGWTKAPDFNFDIRSSTQFEWVRASWEWLVYPWVEWHVIEQNFKHSSGLGAFFATMVPIALLTIAVDLTRKSWLRNAPNEDQICHFSVTTLFTASLFIVVVWWLLEDRQPRYFLGALILGVPLVGRFLTDLPPNYRRYLNVLTAISISIMLFVILSKQTIEFGSRFVVSKQFSRANFYEIPTAIDRLPPESVVLNLSSRAEN